MDLVYKIGIVKFNKKFIMTNNDIILYTSIEKVIIDNSIIDDYNDCFYLMDNDDYIRLPNEKFYYSTYFIMWNETKSKMNGNSINNIIFYTDDGMKTEVIINNELAEESRVESNLKYRKHKINTILDDRKTD